MTGTSDRLRYVLDGLTFPVDRWELIARAEHYGADAATLHDLRDLPPRRYGSLTDVIGPDSLIWPRGDGLIWPRLA